MYLSCLSASPLECKVHNSTDLCLFFFAFSAARLVKSFIEPLEWRMMKLCAKNPPSLLSSLPYMWHHYLSHPPAHGRSPELLTPNQTLSCAASSANMDLTSADLIQSLLKSENHDKPLKVMQGKWLWQTSGLCFLICTVGVVTPLCIRWWWGAEVTCL